MTDTKPIAVLCGEDGCQEEAIYSYVWPWGTPGTCCAHHSILLNQRASQQLDIPGGLRLVALDPARKPEITRDERAHLRANIMVRDDEITGLKAHIARLAKNSSELGEQLQRARRLERDAVALHEQLDQVLAERDAALAEQTELKAEVARLQLIISAAAIPEASVVPARP